MYVTVTIDENHLNFTCSLPGGGGGGGGEVLCIKLFSVVVRCVCLVVVVFYLTLLPAVLVLLHGDLCLSAMTQIPSFQRDLLMPFVCVYSLLFS